MPSTLIRLAVALLAFGVGVSTTMFWIAYRTPEVNDKRVIKLIKINPRHAHPLPPLPPLPPSPPSPPLSPSPPVPTTAELPPPPPPPHIMGGHGLGGVNMERSLLSKPAPTYPATAVASHASGTVEVWVKVDENGRVASARALSGHHLLQEAAVEAAYKARFAPTRLEGQPMTVSGTLTYNFVLP